jgi:hypothetical protein
VLLGAELGTRFAGTPWGRGAIGTAEWTGVRLRDLVEAAGLDPGAREVMPESLDAIRARRPLPLAKAMADDTLVALAMNGEVLPPDHGFPARVVVSGWLGAASIKWLSRIEVSRERLFVPWNTVDYVLIGPGYPSDGPARGPAITGLPASALTELPWPARLRPGPQLIRGRAFAGEHAIACVEYRVDDGPWRPAELSSPAIPGAWVRWQFGWDPEPGPHTLRVRATDERGRAQPDASAWNELGYLQHAVLAHPVRVSRALPGRPGRPLDREAGGLDPAVGAAADPPVGPGEDEHRVLVERGPERDRVRLADADQGDARLDVRPRRVPAGGRPPAQPALPQQRLKPRLGGGVGAVGRAPSARVVRRDHRDRPSLGIGVAPLGPEGGRGLQPERAARRFDPDQGRDVGVPSAQFLTHSRDNTPMPASTGLPTRSDGRVETTVRSS